jgi:hypothetical protein
MQIVESAVVRYAVAHILIAWGLYFKQHTLFVSLSLSLSLSLLKRNYYLLLLLSFFAGEERAR